MSATTESTNSDENGLPEPGAGDQTSKVVGPEKAVESNEDTNTPAELHKGDSAENLKGKLEAADAVKEPKESEITEAIQNGEGNEQVKDAEDAKENDTDKKVEEEEKKEPEYEDILGSGALLKKVLKKGSGRKPRMGEKVTIRWIRDIPDAGKTFPFEELTFVAGEGDVVQALDLVAVLTNEGDEVEVKANHRFMYGEIGLPPDVPPSADFHFLFEIVTIHGEPDYSSMDFDTRFAEAKKKKDRGNFLFKRKEYSNALTSYRMASKIVDPELGCVFPDAAPEKLQELLEFRAVVLCNTSVSQLRCDAHDAAIKSALEATKLSPSYSKAYYRLGQAYEKKGQIDNTIKAFKTALKFDPENSKLLHGELARLTKANKKAKESEQKMYSKMFWGDKPPSLSKPKAVEENSWLSWLWKGALVGAGVVVLTGIGMYKYMNH